MVMTISVMVIVMMMVIIVVSVSMVIIMVIMVSISSAFWFSCVQYCASYVQGIHRLHKSIYIFWKIDLPRETISVHKYSLTIHPNIRRENSKIRSRPFSIGFRFLGYLLATDFDRFWVFTFLLELRRIINLCNVLYDRSISLSGFRNFFFTINTRNEKR